MTHHSPDDLRPLFERALPLLKHPYLVERVAEFMVTGTARMGPYKPGETPWKNYERLDFSVHSALRAVADRTLNASHFHGLTHAFSLLDRQ